MGKSKSFIRGEAKGQSDADRGKPYTDPRDSLSIGIQAIFGESAEKEGYDAGYYGKEDSK